jgi:[ribosomal protein S5]-alanine N-acetyltransferase
MTSMTIPQQSTIQFVPKSLFVTIDTPRLHMRSVQPIEADYRRYAKLYGDPEVMAKYAAGQTKSKEEITARIRDLWAKRWRENDPYSGLAVFKKDDHAFIGHVVLGHGDAPGESEIAYLFHKQFWNQGYGTEAVRALVKDYAPETVRQGYLMDGKPLTRIGATTRPDNPASVRILEKIGMHLVGKEEKYGALRHCYALDLKDLPTEKIRK